MEFLAAQDPFEAMPFLKKVLSATGLGWPQRNWWKFALTLLWPWLIILVPMLGYRFGNQLDLMIRGYSELLMLFNIEIRVLIFAWKQAEFEDFLTIVQGVFDKVRSLGAKSQEFKMVTVANQAIEKAAKAYMIFPLILSIVFLVLPLLQTTAIYVMNRRNGTIEQDFITMTEIHFYELDIRRNIFHYLIYYVCAFPSHCIIGFRVSISGIVASGSIKSINLIFDLVSHKLEKIHEFSGKELYDQFSEIVNIHADALSCIRIFERLSNVAVLVQMVDTALIWICMILCVTNNPTKNSLNLVVLLFIISSETYAFCKLGNELTEKSVTVGRSAFEAQWSELPVDIQKGLSLMIRRSQKWEGLTAARFCPLGIEQFGAMVQTSYSVFVVLKERLQGVN
ncbi:conserved hypothetical protein [Culex quinquefasciatus]|uniref:Odorant receptor n=1 Tax=Culex quinquefasciatus TaxID=7176 RepID=B0WNT5_CULQU|nr:conserved hypothetical protein [Culex quinquefasciatus]|eukprot:XP_001850369.1 conserved hypothetical protein [Culex quinquefasciatus]